MALGNLVNGLDLQCHLTGSPLVENCAEDHLGGVEAHDLSDEELLRRIDCLFELALLLCFEGHAEHELLVVDESQTGRPYPGLRN